MKLQLDTTNLLIKIEESVNLGELVDLLEKLLPDSEWKKFKLETNPIINWINPIKINPFVTPYPYPWTTNPYPYPSTNPWENPSPNRYPEITYMKNDNSNLNSGTYNIELK